MPISKKPILFLLVVFSTSGLLILTALFGRGQNLQPQSTHDRADKGQFPVADYAAPEPVAPDERARRLAKGSRFNGRGSAETGGGVMESSIPLESLRFVEAPTNSVKAFPLSYSDTLVIGEVTDARAYLSTDKTGVYSEFTIRLDEVLKDANKSLTDSHPTTIGTREGGRVRFPSGIVNLYGTNERGMPRVGVRYAFFLKSSEMEDDYSIVTAYELKDGRVYPLDGYSNYRKTVSPPFKAYEGMDEKSFLNELREAIKHPPKTLNGKER